MSPGVLLIEIHALSLSNMLLSFYCSLNHQNLPAAEFARMRSIRACRSSNVTCCSEVFSILGADTSLEPPLPPPAALAAILFMRSRSVVNPALAEEMRGMSVFVMFCKRVG